MADTTKTGTPGNSPAATVPHTPGPWTASGCRVLASPPGWPDLDIGYALDIHPTKRAALANARLMAASPALLAALLALVGAVRDGEPALMAVATLGAVAALALAVGGAQ